MLDVKQLLKQREELSFLMIEADGEEYEELQEQMEHVEHELELVTGMNIEEIDAKGIAFNT